MSFSGRFFCCFAMIATTSLGASTTQPAPKELYRKLIQGGVQAVVIQEPMVPIDAVKSILASSFINGPITPTIGFYTLSLELRPKSATALRIWSQVHPVVYAGQLDGDEVLDLITLPDGRIVFAMAGSLSSIVIRDVSIVGQTRQTILAGIDWSLLAAAVPNKPGRLAAKLGYDKESKKVTVVVSDSLDGTVLTTSFEQKPNAWDFIRVKQSSP